MPNSGLISDYLDRLAATLSKSAAFQAFLGVGGDADPEASALARVKRSTTAIDRPRATVNYGDKFRLAHATTSSGEVTGELDIFLERDIPDAYLPTGDDPRDDDAILTDFHNALGDIAEELHALTRPTAFTDGCLSFEWIEPRGEVILADEQEVDGDTEPVFYVLGQLTVLVRGS